MAALRPDAIINCAAFNDVDGAEARPVDALTSTRSPSGAGQGRRRARRHPGALQHRFRLRRQASPPYTEDDRPIRAACMRLEAAGRMVCRGRAEERMCCGWRVSSGGRRAPGRERQRRRDPENADGRRRAARVRRSNRFADLHHRCGAVTRRLVETMPPFGLYHCVNSGHCTWLEFAQELARQLGGARPLHAGANRRRKVGGGTAPVLRAVERQAAGRGTGAAVVAGRVAPVSGDRSQRLVHF